MEEEKNSRTGVPIDGNTIENIKFIQQEWKRRGCFYGARMTQPNVIKILVEKEAKKLKKENEENENEKV